MKLLIAVPTCRDWKPFFGASLFQLGIHLTKLGVDFHAMIMTEAAAIPFHRQNAVDTALKDGFTHILFIDDDMMFEHQAFDFMLSRDKDFIAANYVPRVTTTKAHTTTIGLDGENVFSKNKTGVEKVAKTGFGFVLLKTSILRSIYFPHFEITMTQNADGKRDYKPEDFYFCIKAREAGIDLYIDHDASKLISHIGNYNYRE